MWNLSISVCAALAIGSVVVTALPHAAQKDKRSLVERDGVKYTRFEHAATGAQLDFVTNSGICETTPGVNTYSGYLSVGTNMNMWYVIFESPRPFRSGSKLEDRNTEGVLIHLTAGSGFSRLAIVLKQPP